MIVRPRIFLITGYARAGKNTVAKCVVERVRTPMIGFPRFFYCHELSFAQPIYAMIRTLFVQAGLNRLSDFEYYQTNKEKPIQLFGGKSLRYLLQTLGTEWGRTLINPTIWIDVLHSHINELPDNATVVITDCRFKDEHQLTLDYFNDGEVALIYVERPNSLPQIQHASEQDIQILKSRADVIINNTGTIEELQEKIDRVLDKWLA